MGSGFPIRLVRFFGVSYGSEVVKVVFGTKVTYVTRAVAVAKSNGPVAKFLYPKFSGVLIPADTPLLAA